MTYATNWAICARELDLARLEVPTAPIDMTAVKRGREWHDWVKTQDFARGWQFLWEGRGDTIELPQGGDGKPDALSENGETIFEIKSMGHSTYERLNTIDDFLLGAHYIRAYLFQLVSYCVSLEKDGTFQLIDKGEKDEEILPVAGAEPDRKCIGITLSEARELHAKFMKMRDVVMNDPKKGCKFCNYSQACAVVQMIMDDRAGVIR